LDVPPGPKWATERRKPDNEDDIDNDGISNRFSAHIERKFGKRSRVL
jgi:hypothetical protein